VDLVISACVDQALLTSCHVAEQLGLPAPFDFRTSNLVTNKMLMKQRMIESGIPTSRFMMVKSAADLEGMDLRYPLMVKPADSHGSFGVRKIDSADRLWSCVEQALAISHTRCAIIEEFCEGIEVSVDAFIADDKDLVLMHSHIQKKPLDGGVNLIFQTVIPADISPGAKDRIEQIVRKIATGFGLRNTPLLLQVLVQGDEVNVIEFSPRIGGGSKHQTVRRVTGFDILEASVASFHGEQVRPKCQPCDRFFSRSHVYALPGSFSRVGNVELLLRDGSIEDFICYKTSGMLIGENFASKDRVGSFMISAESLEQLHARIDFVVTVLEVFDLENRPIMRKDVFTGPHL
jgi:biotin carboxylase